MSSAPQLRTTPNIKPKAMWHEKAGLVVSLNDCPMPTLQPGSSYRPDYFEDNEIWKCFYYKNAIFTPPIFDRLDLTNPQLFDKIIQIGPSAFTLPDSIIADWSRLENVLLDVADHCHKTHPDLNQMPAVTWPRNPHDYGYRKTHTTRAIALRSAALSRDAFHTLCAVVTFVLSLWTGAETTPGRPFSHAFWGLTHRNYAPIFYSWLDRFSQTFVCNVSLGVRAGCFINPYTSAWGPWLPHFVRAGIQVWVVWGHNVLDRDIALSNIRCAVYKYAFPPPTVITAARARLLESENLRREYPFVDDSFPILPSICHKPYQPASSSEPPHIPLPSVDLPHPPTPNTPPPSLDPPCPGPNSRQHRGETLADFLSRLQAGRERRMEKETPSDKQARESREVDAAKKGYSRTCTVFIWKETQGFHIRVKVNRSEVPDIWNEYPASRRVYHGHVNEWDLCPPIPPFSNQLTQDDLFDIQQYEDELDACNSSMNALKAPNDKYADLHSGQIDELSTQKLPAEPARLVFDIVEHLKDRHGFDAHRNPSWTPSLHCTALVGDVVTAKRRLLHESSHHPIHLAAAIENFCNVLMNPSLRVHNLPRAWDLHNLQLDNPHLRLSIGTHGEYGKAYVISSTAAVKPPWVICLYDPTTVLQVYRNRWTTLNEIAQELLLRGITFNTGLRQPEDADDAVEKAYKSTGLGLRPFGYRPRSDDYSVYTSARNELLRSRLGRAALLKGGLIARLARDAVMASDVLDGPSGNTHVVTCGKDELVDDHLSEHHLDIISGVYYVEATKHNDHHHEHLSWWPKDGVWLISGFYSDQWSPDAERWYQDRLSEIGRGKATLYNSTQWRSNLRRYKTHTRGLADASHRLAEGVISRHILLENQ